MDIRTPLRLLVLIAVIWCGACQSVAPAGQVTRIAFGSCNRSDLPQPLWSPILQNRPDLWIWTGDIVYGDTRDMSVLAAKYREQMSNPGYQALLASTPVIGTWDDHDYGVNNGGADYPMKADSQALLLDFLGVPAHDARRQREGVYSSYLLGEVPRRVKVILLDVRYYREPPGARADILGEQQWQWLAGALQDDDAALTLIVSGTQILPADHQWERWAAYPLARQRLLDLIRSSGREGVVLLSGDRHFAELSRSKAAGFYPLIEVTSSGLTHFWEQMPDETNRARIGRFYKGLNFGLIEIFWDAKPGPLLRLQVRDVNNQPRLQLEFPLARLSVAD